MSNLCVTSLILLDHFVIIFNLDLFLTVQAGSRHLIKFCPLKPLSQSGFQTWCSFPLDSSFLFITFELVICVVAPYAALSRPPLNPGLDAAKWERTVSTRWKTGSTAPSSHASMGTTALRHCFSTHRTLKVQMEICVSWKFEQKNIG